MAKKRKHEPNSTVDPTDPLQNQHETQAPVVSEPTSDNQLIENDPVEDVVNMKEEIHEENDSEDQKVYNQTDIERVAADADDDDEPIQNLLEPFSKEQLVMLLCQAAASHTDVTERVRAVADEDPAHRKIFVHGLGWDTNVEILRSSFSQYGEIEDCKAVCDKISGKSKGYGFILFKSRKGARMALKEPQKTIGTRLTSCQLASLGPVVTPSAAPALQAQPPLSEYTMRKIYVSNVGADVDPQKLLAFFSKFGEIEDGPLGLDKLTGKPRGFCLFVYRSAESAKKALQEPHKNFEGNILHCQKAIDGPKGGRGHQQQHHNNQGFGGGGGHPMAPAGYNQRGAAPQALNPALGQALALLATQGAGLGLSNLLGVPQPVPGSTGLHAMYGNQGNITMAGGYGNQTGLQIAYPNQQMGQGWPHHGSGAGQYGGGSYMGQ